MSKPNIRFEVWIQKDRPDFADAVKKPAGKQRLMAHRIFERTWCGHRRLVQIIDGETTVLTQV